MLYVNGEFLQGFDPASITLPMTSIGTSNRGPPDGTVDEVATFGTRPCRKVSSGPCTLPRWGSNPPGFVEDVPITSPSGTLYATTPFCLNADVYGAGPLSYQWRQNGTVVGTVAAYASQRPA